MHVRLTLSLLLLALLPAGGVLAERADRGKQMVIEADRPGTVDLQNQVYVLAGNATITQGTMVIRAERIELRQRPDGFRVATAIGSTARPASYRQKRDGVDEFVEGQAERIEYDGRADTLRFIGNGAVRRLRSGTTVDEITGAQITWNANAELFSVEGGAANPGNPGGRVRAVLSPRGEAAAEGAASAPLAPLAPSRNLANPGEGR